MFDPPDPVLATLGPELNSKSFKPNPSTLNPKPNPNPLPRYLERKQKEAKPREVIRAKPSFSLEPMTKDTAMRW